MRRKNRDALEWIQSQKVHVSGHDVRFPSTHRQFEELVVLGITAGLDPFLHIHPFRLARQGCEKGSNIFLTPIAPEPLSAPAPISLAQRRKRKQIFSFSPD